jgi:signal transduction histidine kinase
VIGKTLREAFPAGEADTFIPLLDNVYRTGVPYIGKELPLQLPDEQGKMQDLWIDIGYHPFLDSDGQIKGVFALVHDVTDSVLARKKVEESESRAREEVLRQRTHPDDVERVHQKLRDAIQKRAPRYDEYRIIKPDGNLRWIMTRSKIKLDAKGGPESMSGVITDITERKDAEIKLGDALIARDTFLGIASHELKTPLTSLKLQAEMSKRQLARRGPSSITAEGFERVLNSTLLQTERLERLIDDMLDVSRIQSGKLTMNMAETNLSNLVRDITKRFKPQFEAADSDVIEEMNEDICVELDAARIEQVLVNLINNAIKYAPGKPVKVKLSQTETGVKISVEDQGKGIEPKDQLRIFERFERASPSDKVTGLGLGLYI